jgi:hypothetical protein
VTLYFAYVEQYAVLIIKTATSLITQELCVVEKKVEESNIHLFARPIQKVYNGTIYVMDWNI